MDDMKMNQPNGWNLKQIRGDCGIAIHTIIWGLEHLTASNQSEVTTLLLSA